MKIRILRCFAFLCCGANGSIVTYVDKFGCTTKVERPGEYDTDYVYVERPGEYDTDYVYDENSRDVIQRHIGRRKQL